VTEPRSIPPVRLDGAGPEGAPAPPPSPALLVRVSGVWRYRDELDTLLSIEGRAPGADLHP
jgi:hypothetical protein